MRRSRAAILPYPGDPFLFNYWLRFFVRVWGDEVDTLYVYLNSPIEAPVVEYIRSLCAERPKINFQYNPQQIEHGEAINRVLDIVTEKYIMLIEDDAFIFKSGYVNHCFGHLESGSYDIVGSKRGSCSLEISEAAKQRWGLSYEGYGDQGPNFWPCFFFCSRQLLLSTDRVFGARAWNQGETIDSLRYVVEVPVVAGDTFVNTSLQLRNMVPEHRIVYVPQYHAHPDDMDHALSNTCIFDGHAPWVHIGSLSSGVGGVLKDDQNRCLSRRTIDPAAGETQLGSKPQSDMELKEWERRVQMWCTFLRDADREVIKDFQELYWQAIERIIKTFGLSMGNISVRQRVYKERLGL
jgi:hypothetical protein